MNTEGQTHRNVTRSTRPSLCSNFGERANRSAQTPEREALTVWSSAPKCQPQSETTR